jgi:hypothetical protein
MTVPSAVPAYTIEEIVDLSVGGAHAEMRVCSAGKVTPPPILRIKKVNVDMGEVLY